MRQSWKKLFVFMSSFAFMWIIVSSHACAQQEKQNASPPRRSSSLWLLHTYDVREALKMTSAQEAKYAEIQTSARLLKIADPKARLEKTAEFDKEVDKILTTAQLARLKEIELQKQGAPALILPHIIEALSITDDQAKAIDELHQKNIKDLRALKNEDRRIKVKEIVEKELEDAMKILTPVQREKFVAMRGEKFEEQGIVQRPIVNPRTP
jgi:hypothetical protein